MRVGINLYRRDGVDGGSADGVAISPREVEMAACGAFFLRQSRPEGDEVLAALPTFTEPGEATDLLRWYLARPDERAERASRARAAIADRTFDNQARALLALLDR
jgi:hypothetical protein